MKKNWWNGDKINWQAWTNKKRSIIDTVNSTDTIKLWETLEIQKTILENKNTIWFFDQDQTTF